MKLIYHRKSLPFMIAALLVSGCGSAGTEANRERTDDFTDILSNADRSATSTLIDPLSGEPLRGSATYDGVAAADFGTFTGTADAEFVADFDAQTIGGRMTDWEDGQPLTNELRGEVVLSNATIDRTDGTFSGLVTGNLERRSFPEFNPGFEGTFVPGSSPVVVVLDGRAEGEFYDSESGEVATHIAGGMAADYVDANGGRGVMTGGFVAER